MTRTLTPTDSASDTVAGLLAEIAHTGADATRGGYSRPMCSAAELDLRSWFEAHAEKRGLDVDTDGNGVIWAWHAPDGSRDGAVVTGSHLDWCPEEGRTTARSGLPPRWWR